MLSFYHWSQQVPRRRAALPRAASPQLLWHRAGSTDRDSRLRSQSWRVSASTDSASTGSRLRTSAESSLLSNDEKLPSVVDSVKPRIQTSGKRYNHDPPLQSRPANGRHDSQLANVIDEIEKQFPQGHVPRTSWGDVQWARVYATRFLSLNAVIGLLKLFKATTIGGSSMREVLLRCIQDGQINMSVLREHLAALQESDIPVERTVFCRLALKMAAQGNDRVLLEMAESDMHPDEYANHNLQETLLLVHDSPKDARMIEKTWEVLLVDAEPATLDAIKLNVLLRRAISRNDEAVTCTLVEQMRAGRVIVEGRSLRYMFQRFLLEQSNGSQASPLNLNLLVQLWTTFMDYGCRIPPRDWGGVLHALAEQGDFQKLDVLGAKIVMWYMGTYRKNIEWLQNQFDDLFHEGLIRHVLKYSFHHGGLRHHSESIPLEGQDKSNRAALLAVHPAYHGLRLLVRLRDQGARIDIAVIQKVLRLYIRLLHSSEGLILRSGAVVRRLPGAHEPDYFRASEMIIGEADARRQAVDRFRRRRYRERNTALKQAHPS